MPKTWKLSDLKLLRMFKPSAVTIEPPPDVPSSSQAGSSSRRVHELFNSDDSDLTIESDDGVLFLLHRRNLESHTSAFPGAEWLNSEGEVTYLTEPANVLEVIFQFVYPRRPPTLNGLDFDVVLQVAEAVEKYEVFSAMHVCEARLRDFINDHTKKILLHAFKHDCQDLLNESARLLARSPSADILNNSDGILNPAFIMTWVRYTEAWNSIFDEVILHLKSKPLGWRCASQNLCVWCRNCLIVWVTELKQIPTMGGLFAALNTPRFKREYSYILTTLRSRYRSTMGGGNIMPVEHDSPFDCYYTDKIVRLIRSKAAQIVKFTDLILTGSGTRVVSVPSETKRVHELFNSNDSDLTIESADGVQFLLHRQNFESHMGAFPGSEFQHRPQANIIYFDEPARVLELVFQFLYPRRHPTLEDVRFGLMLQVAECVEKYKVFSALHVCQARLRAKIRAHPKEILVYAIKHDYPDLMNDSALLLARSKWSDILNHFSGSLDAGLMISWVRYMEAWDSIFRQATKMVTRTGYRNRLFYFKCIATSSVNGWFCPLCRNSLVVWINELKQAPIKELLSFSSKIPSFQGGCHHCYGSSPQWERPTLPTSIPLPDCKHVMWLAPAIQSMVAQMPRFTQFIPQKPANANAASIS